MIELVEHFHLEDALRTFSSQSLYFAMQAPVRWTYSQVPASSSRSQSSLHSSSLCPEQCGHTVPRRAIGFLRLCLWVRFGPRAGPTLSIHHCVRKMVPHTILHFDMLKKLTSRSRWYAEDGNKNDVIRSLHIYTCDVFGIYLLLLVVVQVWSVFLWALSTLERVAWTLHLVTASAFEKTKDMRGIR